jgi:hypothetical protein
VLPIAAITLGRISMGKILMSHSQCPSGKVWSNASLAGQGTRKRGQLKQLTPQIWLPELDSNQRQFD